MKNSRKISRHHRRCRSNGGTDDNDNLSQVSSIQHKAFHILFLNKNVYEIAEILNETWIDPRFNLVVVKKE